MLILLSITSVLAAMLLGYLIGWLEDLLMGEEGKVWSKR